MMPRPKANTVSPGAVSGTAFVALGLIVAAQTNLSRAQGPSSQPPAGDLREASVAMRYDTRRYCPQLHQAHLDEEGAAVVVFRVGPSGVPSQPSIRTSSGSSELDTAASACVMTLRFNPRVHAGDGTAMDSWQQAAWKWNRTAAQVPSPPAALAPAPPAPALTAGAHTAAASVVRVCADENGHITQGPNLVQSSGDAGFDASAVRIARAGAASTGAAAAGCLRLAITPDHD